MGFWICMFVVSLLIPVSMLVIGRLFIKRPPRTVNSAYGYRTAWSMKNAETWAFAHAHCGKTWQIVGLAMLPVTIAAMLLLYRRSEGVVGTWSGIVVCLQLVPLIGSIFPTERALKMNFDEDGNRCEGE